MKRKSSLLAWFKKHKAMLTLGASLLTAVVLFATKVWPEGKKSAPLTVNQDSQNATIVHEGKNSDTSKPGPSISQEKNENSKNTIIDNSTNAPVDRSTHKHYYAAPQRHVTNADIKQLKTIPKDMKVILCIINGDQNTETIKYKEEIRTKLLEMGYNVHPSTSTWNGSLTKGKRIEVGPDEFAGWYMVKVYTM